jgi:Putative undecaprenyl diphosphate synthase
VNFLVHYDWEWDLSGLREGQIRSQDVPRLDLIVRWGGGRRLSGFLPVQSVYADFFFVDDYWPDFRPEHLDRALDWFKQQDSDSGRLIGPTDQGSVSCRCSTLTCRSSRRDTCLPGDSGSTVTSAGEVAVPARTAAGG